MYRAILTETDLSAVPIYIVFALHSKAVEIAGGYVKGQGVTVFKTVVQPHNFIPGPIGILLYSFLLGKFGDRRQ